MRYYLGKLEKYGFIENSITEQEEEMGYHRRDKEVEELVEQLTDMSP